LIISPVCGFGGVNNQAVIVESQRLTPSAGFRHTESREKPNAQNLTGSHRRERQSD
jgi:hypothetical protein